MPIAKSGKSKVLFFSDVRDGTFMFNFFLNKIKAFHSQIACGKAQLSHKFLSKAPTMGNSHLFLVMVDTFVLNHSQTISSTVLTTKVLNLRMTKVQNLSQIALMDALIPLNCLKLWKRKMPGIRTSPPTSRAMTLNERATTECTFLLLHWNIVFHPAKMSSRVLIYQHYYDAFNESFDEDKLIAYIKTHFMEIRNDLWRTYTWSLIK